MRIKSISLIAREEWRYWRRSKLGITSAVIMLMIVLASLISTAVQVESERTTRESFQASAEQTFKEQPPRHPHRMVHYGHYVFRSPAPLAIVDPGVDVHTGTIMFLEGHRQNSAMFSPRYAKASAGPFAFLTPAFVYQILVPLLLIIMGFASIARERESKTDYLLVASTVSSSTLWLGKTLALVSVALLSLVPLLIALFLALNQGESLLIALMFLMSYLLYLVFWSGLITSISAWAQNSSLALMLLVASWLMICVVMPRMVSTAADLAAPLDGKIAKDFEMTRALREEGDGHNANDPAFETLRAQILEQYEVENIEELPINFRGVVAKASESKLTNVMNAFADERMNQEVAQLNFVKWFSPLSPALSAKSLSMTLASTGLRQHHRFLRDAEALRFDFIQKLNQLHIDDLAYADDMRRSIDKESEQRTRLDAANWRLLKTFPWQSNSVGSRLTEGASEFLILLLWCLGTTLFGLLSTKRLFTENNG